LKISISKIKFELCNSSNRFPFVAGENGGGAFLIPYLVVLTIIGRPMYLMEFGLGQFASSGPVKVLNLKLIRQSLCPATFIRTIILQVWALLPAFRGIGYGAALASFFIATFYVCVMGWAVVYFGYSCYQAFAWEDETPGPFFELAANSQNVT